MCGSDQLYQRDDDKLETAQNRLKVYFEQTMPLIDYYRQQGNLHEVDGQRDITEVTDAMVKALENGAHSGQ